MKKENILLWGLVVTFAVMMSLPFLLPHTGLLALFGFVPLLCMERLAGMTGERHIWIYHYSAFVLWNAITTFWVCNATLGGGIFATLANSLQMSLIFGLFRLSKKKFKATLPYIFLACAWIAWERFYFDAEISWPWLVLGNAFGRSIWAVQWYEITGTLGGSLWVWACNLSVFGLMVALSDGSWAEKFNNKAKTAVATGIILLFTAPLVLSFCLTPKENDNPEETIDVLIAQPNFDPYHKFEALSQTKQNAILSGIFREKLDGRQADSTRTPLLLLAPETFTNDITTNDIPSSRSWQYFKDMLSGSPNVNLIFGAMSRTYIHSIKAPSATARKIYSNSDKDQWMESHNSALIVDGQGNTDIFHKSRLVVAVEKTPYPALFCKIDDLLGGVMGRCVGQDEISLLNFRYRDSCGVARSIPLGCAVCYESIYGEYYTGYIRKGARAMTIITNDAWWGDTPGYRQHLSYASLRAIETRRAIARCANTGISAFISPSGKILSDSHWWERESLEGRLELRDDITFFVAHGDITGRICTFLFLLFVMALIVRFLASAPYKTHKS